MSSYSYCDDTQIKAIDAQFRQWIKSCSTVPFNYLQPERTYALSDFTGTTKVDPDFIKIETDAEMLVNVNKEEIMEDMLRENLKLRKEHPELRDIYKWKKLLSDVADSLFDNFMLELEKHSKSNGFMLEWPSCYKNHRVCSDKSRGYGKSCSHFEDNSFPLPNYLRYQHARQPLPNFEKMSVSELHNIYRSRIGQPPPMSKGELIQSIVPFFIPIKTAKQHEYYIRVINYLICKVRDSLKYHINYTGRGTIDDIMQMLQLLQNQNFYNRRRREAQKQGFKTLEDFRLAEVEKARVEKQAKEAADKKAKEAAEKKLKINIKDFIKVAKAFQLRKIQQDEKKGKQEQEGTTWKKRTYTQIYKITQTAKNSHIKRLQSQLQKTDNPQQAKLLLQRLERIKKTYY